MFSDTTFAKLLTATLLTPLVVAGPAVFSRAAVPVAESVPDRSVGDSSVRDTPAREEAAIAAAGSSSDQITLVYEAYVAGINAGEARLALERQSVPAIKLFGAKTAGERRVEERQYRVAGTARSKGLWESVQQWRAEYSVDGILRLSSSEKGQAESSAVFPEHFYSLQTTPKKRREIHIEAGVLRETKNNKVRDPRPAQTGFDLLTALFFLPPCHAEVRVHTGRDGYEMRRAGVAGDMRCTYSVEDEEGGRYEMTLAYVRRDGFTVPAEIAVQGPLSGRMILADSVKR